VKQVTKQGNDQMSKAKTHKQSAAKKQLDLYIEFHMAIDSLLMYDAEIADGWDGPDARANTLEALKALIKGAK
jgi:hypothetical protein